MRRVRHSVAPEEGLRQTYSGRPFAGLAAPWKLIWPAEDALSRGLAESVALALQGQSLRAKQHQKDLRASLAAAASFAGEAAVASVAAQTVDSGGCIDAVSVADLEMDEKSAVAAGVPSAVASSDAAEVAWLPVDKFDGPAIVTA